MIWDIKNIQTPSGFHGKGYQWMRAPVWPLWPWSKPALGSLLLSSRPFPPETVGRELTRGMLRKTEAWPLMQLLVVSWCLLLVVLSSRKISTYQLQTNPNLQKTGTRLKNITVPPDLCILAPCLWRGWCPSLVSPLFVPATLPWSHPNSN